MLQEDAARRRREVTKAYRKLTGDTLRWIPLAVGIAATVLTVAATALLIAGRNMVIAASLLVIVGFVALAIAQERGLPPADGTPAEPDELLNVRDATDADATALARIRSQAFAETIASAGRGDRASARDDLRWPDPEGADTIVAELANRIVATARYWWPDTRGTTDPRRPMGAAFVDLVAVIEERRSEGIGMIMLDSAARRAGEDAAPALFSAAYEPIMGGAELLETYGFQKAGTLDHWGLKWTRYKLDEIDYPPPA